MARLGVPQSKDTLLRALKRGVRNRAGAAPVRVVGIDDWSWRKGTTYGTIVVDLERREVLDILQDRSAEIDLRMVQAASGGVRHAGGECIGAFRPRAVGLPRQERHLKYRWNGDRVDRYFDYLRDAWVDL